LGADKFAGTFASVSPLVSQLNLTISDSSSIVTDLSKVLGASGKADITGGAGADTIIGGKGDDTIDGGSGDDIITGGSGADGITVSLGVDTITDWGNGNDTLTINSGATAVYPVVKAGGDVRSFASQTNNGTLFVDGSAAKAFTVIGSAGKDSITGGNGADVITGGAEVDTIDAGAGNDTLKYVAATDLFDSLTNAAVDSIVGGDGTDTLLVGNTVGASFTIANTANWSRISDVEVIKAVNTGANAVSITLGASAAVAGINKVDLSDVTKTTGNVIDVSTFTSSTDTTLIGPTATTAAANITGGEGNDRIVAAGNGGTIDGKGGLDIITLGAGADIVVMGQTTEGSADTVIGFKTAGADKLYLGDGSVSSTVNTVAKAYLQSNLVIDTAANLGDTGFNLGSVNTAVKYAIASDTGAIYYDADGNWATNSVKIGSIGTGTGVVTGDVKVGSAALVAGSITYSVATISAADLVEADTAVSGFIDASSITSITAASVADATRVLVTYDAAAGTPLVAGDDHTSGNYIKHATDVAVTLITDTTASGTDLVAIDNATTGKVTANTITSITSATAEQANQLLVTNRLSFISKSDVDVALTGTGTMAHIKAVEAATTGFVNASAVTDITAASIADAKLILVTNKGTSGDKISHKTDVNVALTGTTAVAADLKAIDGETTGLVDASTVTSITALDAADYTLVGGASASGNAVKTNASVAVTFADEISAANVDTVRGLTSGVVTATVTAGTAANLVTALASSGEDALTLSLTAATQAADKINTLNGKTSVAIVASAATKITGIATDISSVLTAVTAGTVGALATNVAIDVSDGTTTAAQLKAIEAATTGFVDASLVAAITSSTIDDAKLVLITKNGSSLDKISHKSDVTVALTDTTATAADLSAIGGATTGTVTVSNGVAISGNKTDVTAALVTGDTKVVLGAASTVTVSDAVTAAEGKAIADVTSATATFTLGVNDSASNLSSAGTITSDFSAVKTEQGSVPVTISVGTIAMADLKAIEAATTGFVNASAITAITAAPVADALSLLVTKNGTTGDTISHATNVAVTLSDVGSVSNTISILGATTGVVTTGALNAGTYTGFATGDKIDTGLSFSANVSTPSANDSNLTWAFSAGTLTYESVDAGTATNVALVLTGVTAVAETGGVFTLTV
jgi:hypothetical protein